MLCHGVTAECRPATTSAGAFLKTPGFSRQRQDAIGPLGHRAIGMWGGAPARAAARATKRPLPYAVGVSSVVSILLASWAMASAAGQPGVERAIGLLKDEIERGMKLMGVKSVSELNRDRLRWR